MFKKFFSVLYFLLIPMLCSGGEQSLTKNDAISIIDEHFKQHYDFPIPKKVEFYIEKPKNYNLILCAYRYILISTEQTESMLGKNYLKNDISKPSSGDVFIIKLTEKGKSTPHIDDQENGLYLFESSTNYIEDIVQIVKNKENEWLILFTFREELNEFGTIFCFLLDKYVLGKCTLDKSKFRGKAIIKHDPFLKKYVLINLLRSQWEKEKWYPARWVTTEAGKKKINFGKMDPNI